MPRAVPAQTGFNAGQWSPSMYGRVDHNQYYKACRRMENFYPKVQGPAGRRGGTMHVATLKTQSAAGALIPFEFGVTQAYMLLFENNLFRIARDHGIVENPPGTPVEVVTTYATADLPTIKYAQSADTLYLAHPSYAPRKITRTSHTAWSITTISFVDGPWLAENTTATTLDPDDVTGNVTITASSTTGINDGQGFLSTDVGRLIRFKATVWHYLRITAVTDTTHVDADVVGANLGGHAATASWRLGAWSGTTGYPAAVTFFQDRLCWGGEPSQTVHMSKTGDYENMAPDDAAATPTVADDDAVSVTLNANNVNVIRWLADNDKALAVGTVGGEWLVSASVLGEAVTPSDVKAVRSTTYGSANVQPVQPGEGLLFVQRAGLKVHEHAYSFEADGYRSPNMTLFAETITGGGLTRLAWQQEPDRIVWCLRTDGRLVGFSYSREEQVVAWHIHTIGGYSDSGQSSPAVVESIAVIPAPDGSRDELWLIVQRYINGGVKRYIEYMTAPLADTGDQEDATYLDSMLTYDSTPVTTVTGATHLIGQTVSILADGATHPTAVVDGSGEVDLVRSASVVQIGLPFTSTLETMNLEAGSADGTAQGRTKRIDHLMLRLHRSLGGRIGADESTLDQIPYTNFRSPSTPMGDPPPLCSGDVMMPFPGGYNDHGRIVLQTSDPLPFMVSMLSPHVSTNQK